MNINTGYKQDSDKVQPSLVLQDMARALLAVSEVATFGAKKYSPGNWLKVADGVNRYTNAMDRHRLIEAIDRNDEESGLKHAAHVAWNALARLELMIREESMPTKVE